jgi:hypothetical protein
VIVRMFGALVLGQSWLVWNARKITDGEIRRAFVQVRPQPTCHGASFSSRPPAGCLATACASRGLLTGSHVYAAAADRRILEYLRPRQSRCCGPT